MQLEAAQASHQAGGAEADRQIEAASRTARESLREVRRLVWDLRPETLEQHTLGDALTRLTTGLSEQTGILARAVVTGDMQQLPPQVEVTALRVAQEALANVRRHAEAGKATVTLSYMGEVVAIDVQDDGVGFDPSEAGVPPARRTSRFWKIGDSIYII